MKHLAASVALVSALTGSAGAALAQSATVAAVGNNGCTSVALTENTESVQVGAVAVGNVTLTGGPASCVASLATDNSNARATLETKYDAVFVRITALHEGFTNISVLGANGSPIGTIKVTVYPRDRRGSV